MKPFVRVAAIVCLPGVVAACAGSSALISESTEHCKAALGRIVGPNDSVFVHDSSRAQTSLDGRAVETVTLEMDLNDKPVTMQCAYPVGLRLPGASSNALAITFAGRPMPADQLAAVNRAVDENDSPFKTFRKHLPTLPGVNVDQTQGRLGHNASTPRPPPQQPGDE